MLKAFILGNRDTILARARARVAKRMDPPCTETELKNGIPIFLDQLCDVLTVAESTDVVDHREMGESAALHGHDLFRMGLSIGQVVHDYGDVCQVITELAVEQSAPVPPDEFRVLNLCLDDAIAEAVGEFARQTERKMEEASTERLGILAHELRNLINSAVLAFEVINRGTWPPAGAPASCSGGA